MPTFLPEALAYETLMGSHAYGVNGPDSDLDYYGFCVPPAEVVFPHLTGMVPGFDRPQEFEQFQAQHIYSDGQARDFTIYSIVKYFRLVADGNPNMVDSLFTSPKCVTFANEVGKMVKLERHLFLSQKLWHRFKGMAWSHLARLNKGVPKEGRKALHEKYGLDTKDAYHTVRMVLQIEELMTTGDLNLRANVPTLLEVRRGEWTLERVTDFFETKMAELDLLYGSPACPLAYSPDTDALRRLLMVCLETSYGNLSKLGVRKTK